MRYLAALTTLRFVAASMIVVHHVHPYFGIGTGVLGNLALDQGVSFFFVLSGFILYYRHGEIVTAAEGRRFVAARIARIWPLHIAALALLLLFVPAPFGPAGLAPGPTIANLLLLQAWVPWPGYFFSYNAVSWSLSTELFFYVAYPWISAGFRRSWPWKLALAAVPAIAMIALASRLNLGFYDGADRLSIDALVYINPLARVFEFVLGMAAGEAWRRLSATAPRVPAAAGTVLELAALALGFAGLTIFRDASAAAFARGDISAATLKWLVSSGSAPCFAVVAVVFAAGRGLVSRALSWRPLVVLGEISFALYLCHVLLFRALTTSGSLAAYGGIRTQFAVYCAMVLGLSYALHMLVERPCQSALLARLSPRRLRPG